MNDVEENATIVNALQRHATVVIQKSLEEGFGLTVAEAMWKKRPVLASAVGGIRDQIVDGRHGVLLESPTDLRAFGAKLTWLLGQDGERARMAERAHRRVRDEFVGDRELVRSADLIVDLLERAHAR
jgi:trehalose synthase